MSDSESSGLSSAPATEDEMPPPIPIKMGKAKKGTIKAFFNKKQRSPSSSPEPERPSSPPHEYVLADNPDIAVIVMFRSRFAEVFPRGVPNIGPQDVESGVVSSHPSEPVEGLLCGLLSLVLNRKKDVEKGHYGRALEDCISSQKHQWPSTWNGVNPLSGAKTFNTMNPTERIDLLKTLVLWSMNSSEAIMATMKESYKQSRHDDDLNQPLSIQPWGMDDLKRRYWLVEGLNDTPFRIYRQNAKKETKESWFSVAGSIEEAKALSESLQANNKSQAAQRFAKSILNAVPRFEETLEKRKRKEYRQNRKAQFARPEPGVSLYEGRTRGKRARYTFDDDEDDYGSETSTRKSLRDASGTATPNDAPTVTSSGRQIRSRFGRSYGDPMDTREDSEAPSSEDPADGRRRSGRARGSAARTRELYSDDSADELGDDEDEGGENDWSGDDNDITGRFDDDEDEDMSDASLDGDDAMDEDKHLVVVLKYPKGANLAGKPAPPSTPPHSSPMAPLNGTSTLIPTPTKDVTPKNDASPDPLQASPAFKASQSHGSQLNGVTDRPMPPVSETKLPSFQQYSYQSPSKPSDLVQRAPNGQAGPVQSASTHTYQQPQLQQPLPSFAASNLTQQLPQRSPPPVAPQPSSTFPGQPIQLPSLNSALGSGPTLPPLQQQHHHHPSAMPHQPQQPTQQSLPQQYQQQKPLQTLQQPHVSTQNGSSTQGGWH